MRSFSIDSFIKPAYEKFPAGECRPVIGVTANYVKADATVSNYYYNQVIAAGGVPVVIPPVADADVIINTLGKIDGLLLTGGADHNPLWSGEEPLEQLHGINDQRDAAELLTVRLAYDRQIPMLGICRGIQTLAVALGGHVMQDIDACMAEKANNKAGSSQSMGARLLSAASLRGKSDNTAVENYLPRVKHSQDADRNVPTHTVSVATDSTLFNIYKSQKLLVNSFHHQAIDEPGDKFRVTARALDGVVEAMESTEYKNIMGVQWHPECLGEDGLPLFRWLVDSAKERQEVIRVHQKVITLDTHCDTPMFFHQGVDFTKRDNRILVDLQKMTEGHQDATIMVAYLPQPAIGEQFSNKVNLDWLAPEIRAKGISPMQYAESIFDKIEDTVSRMPQYLSIARTPADLIADKRCGRKSIMLGIENGIAIEHDLRNLHHFAQRGIVYMTLCHNGDNDICDSAKGCNTHKGVSSFGAKVIQEMNKLGIMVDMSHAGEKSFYDALDISSQPIVCSHSNCRALCDHPRNLTDDQLRALSMKGGLAHTTFYHGFLRKVGEADILDGIKHLEHAISVMGIDHVGIGTDFDGDGGVRGMRDSSEIMQFTLQLLRRRYSEDDIRKIWGGNWLRLMNSMRSPQRGQ